MSDKMSTQKQLAERINLLRKKIETAYGTELSDADFAKRFLPFSSTTLSRVMNTTKVYAGSLDHVTEQVVQAEEEIDERLATIKQLSETERQFVNTKLACAVQAAVKKARDSRGRRVVVLLAPTGAGKSAVGEFLAARGAVYVEGRQSWKSSYKAFCSDVAKAAGRPMRARSSKYNEHEAESRMIEAMKAKDGILYIDEANTLGPSSANAIKLIVNLTGYTVVIAAIPETWDKFLNGAEDEVNQVINRAQPVLRYKGLSEADALPFMQGSGLSGADISKTISTVVQAANEFGAFKTIVNLVDELKKIESPTAEDVANYLKFNTKNLAQSGVKKGQQK